MANKKILIVDDDENIRKALRRLLILENKYEIDEAADGGEAEEKIKRFVPDLILLDVRMPGKYGHEICLDIRMQQNMNTVKIVGISGYAGHINDAIMRACGADAFFEKPFDNEKLKNKVAQLLGV